MDQNNNNNNLQPPTGPGGRRLHIAHRRSPSELTPLMMEQLALQQQIELLQQQQQQLAAVQNPYAAQMNMLQSQQAMPGFNGQMPTMPQQAGAYSFPQQFQQQQQQQMPMAMGQSMHAPSSHRRNQSALPGMSMGPPPAPSSGASGSAFANDFSQRAQQENANPRNARGPPPGAGHNRRHSLALPEAKKAAELAEQKRKTSGFQFPIPGSAGATSPSPVSSTSPGPQESSASIGSASSLRGVGRGTAHGRSQSMAVGNGRGAFGRGGSGFSFPAAAAAAGEGDLQRRGSGHGRSQSRNFEGNWRQQSNLQEQQQQPQPMGSFGVGQNQTFQPGHRSRQSMNQSIGGGLGNFQFQAQPQIVQLPNGQMVMQPPQIFPGQGLNQLQLAQLQALQTAQANGQSLAGLQGQQLGQMGAQQGAQQQRKTLFAPYLPQANLPALLSDGHLVAGILRVNKKNRSDAYVTSPDLDADIFICGSKDRNRALENDLVAIELLDVDEVWSQKREKEEKKKRKDMSEARTSANDATTGGEAEASGGLRRRGSLRQRPTQKKNDDVEVEGQSLLLMEEEEINDEQKPLYAGHVVAVIERVAGQMFSGTLCLLRPSSQATKEKQEAERGGRDGGRGQDRQQDKPKIVWFKPTDKRVPLIAIPTEQAPRDFVERHQQYANRIFVACIKRWPITSLHPFGTLVEQLGEMGDLKVETDALLRDNNFGPDEFSDAVHKSIGFPEWSVENDGEAGIEGRRDFREEPIFSIDPSGANDLDDAFHCKKLADGNIEIGVHVADVAHFIRANSLVDREAKKRGTGVYLMNRTVNMLPARLAHDLCCLVPDQDRYAVSVLFTIDPKDGHVLDENTWIGKSVVRSSGKISYEETDSVIKGKPASHLHADRVEQIQTLHLIAQKLRNSRFGDQGAEAPPLRLLFQLDDENIPVEANIFDCTPSHELVEEISNKANALVAQKLFDTLGDKAWLRRQQPPNPRRLQTFAERMTYAGYEIDTTSSGALQNSLFAVADDDIRKGMETLLVKAMQRAKYCVAGKTMAEEIPHFALNLPLFTHFTNPTRRYADIIVHRQLEAVLTGNVTEISEDLDSLAKTAELCNTKKDSAQVAQEQSVHIEACRNIDRRRNELGGDLICEGVVLCVYESAFDILIPEFGFEKRVHCDQLPLKKAEFDKGKRVLELYWEKGVPSSAYIPEDERSKSALGMGRSTSTRSVDFARQKEREREEAQRRQVDTGTFSSADTDALFDDDDDDDDGINGITHGTAGVSLSASEHAPVTSGTEERIISGDVSEATESKLPNKDRFRKLFRGLREESGDCIQDVTEMTKVPVILKTDLTKSPPCLTIRSVNPFAL